MLRMRLQFLTILLLAASSGELGAQQSGGNILVSAGFVVRTADTQGKLAALQALPPNKFIHRHAKDGAVYYIYADHGRCACAYVGSQQAMDSYRQMRSRALTPEQLGAGSDPTPHPVEENIIYGMQHDDFENQFNRDAFDPDAAPGFVPGFRQ
jgi:hypothetical protein